MHKLVLVAVAVACLLAGWLTGGGNHVVTAQTVPAPVPLPSECYTVYDMIGDSNILLNECSGESWWYDDGYESEGGQVRPRSWRTLQREQ